MSTELLVAAVVIVAIAIAAAWWYSTRRRSEQLRESFGPEYERAVAEHGDTREGEVELTNRQKRVAGFDIRPLPAEQREAFSNEWRAVQARFVDDPSGAVAEADKLVGLAMAARGYPTGDFDQRAADVSVDHPQVVAHYRAAHDIAARDAEGHASTEDLRQAIVDYRALFADLLEESAPTGAEPGPVEQAVPR